MHRIMAPSLLAFKAAIHVWSSRRSFSSPANADLKSTLGTKIPLRFHISKRSILHGAAHES